MKPDYEAYTLTPRTPVTCGGIRVSGCAGGSAYFISCGELIVKATAAEAPAETEATAPETEATAPETEAAPIETEAETEAETTAPETVEETVAPEKTEETTETAPQTADLALISAALAAVSSLGAYAVSKKKR